MVEWITQVGIRELIAIFLYCFLYRISKYTTSCEHRQPNDAPAIDPPLQNGLVVMTRST